MRRGIAILLLAALLVGLCACGKEPEVSPTLDFQGIPWNSSSEEVFEKLGLDEEKLEREVEEHLGIEYYYVSVMDWEIFGETALAARFCFMNFHPEESDYFGLTNLQIFYPEDCDKEEILSSIRKTYGDEAETFTICSPRGTESTYTKEEGNYFWVSQRLLNDVLTEQGTQDYRASLGDVTDENFDAWMLSPVAQIHWVEDYYSQFETPMEDAVAQNGRMASLSFSGARLAVLQQMFETVQ